MTRLPPLKARQVTRGLKALGFKRVRQKGSHVLFHHDDCRRTTLPVHPGKDISPYLMSDILRQIEVSEETFLAAIGQKR